MLPVDPTFALSGINDETDKEINKQEKIEE
jgi:hypothetical protein